MKAVREFLERIKREDLYRKLRLVTSPQGPEFILDGKKVINNWASGIDRIGPGVILRGANQLIGVLPLGQRDDTNVEAVGAAGNTCRPLSGADNLNSTQVGSTAGIVGVHCEHDPFSETLQQRCLALG